MEKRKIIGIIFLIFTVLIWGITFLATETLLEDFTPIEIMFFRFGLSYLSMLLLYPKPFKWQGWKVEGLCLLASMFGMSIYQTCENYAIEYANGSVVSIIIACASFFTAIFSHFILKTKIKKSFYIGFFISLIGISFVIMSGNSLSIEPLGDFIAIGCAILWGLYSVTVEIINKNKLNLIQVTRRINMYAFIALIPMFFISGGKFNLVRFTEVKNVIWILYLGILASAICFYTWNYSVDVLGSVITSLGVLVQPLVTVIVGVLFFNHKFTWIGVIGIVLTLAGLYVALFLKKKQKEVVPKEG